MSASTAGKDRQERQDNSNKRQATEIKDVVDKRLGLKTNQTNGSSTQKKDFGAYNLKGKDIYMYGEEASQFTNDEMVNRGLAQEGNYFKKVGGNFVRVSKNEGKKLYGEDPSISRSVLQTSNSNKIKFGNNNEAMGSGDPSGAMTSTPISKNMLQSQNKTLGLLTAALSLTVPAVGGTIMRGMAAKNLKDAATPGKAYTEYTKKFKAIQSGKKPPKKSTLISDVKGGINKLKTSLGE
tara:strand:+ start:122 stop:832 length:711 start_codon:yes stop_codon:yes gene_type:complete